MAGVMQRLGYRCGHEAVYRPFAPEDGWEADSSAMAPCFPRAGKVIQVIRHPLKYVRSQLLDRDLFRNAYGRLLLDHCPEAARYQAFGEDPTLEWAVRFWIDWNAKIEADYWFQIEEVGPHVIKDIVELLGDAPSGDIPWALETAPRHEHVRAGSPEMAWLEMPFREALGEAAERWGYERG
jgi:hypothetical protein